MKKNIKLFLSFVVLIFICCLVGCKTPETHIYVFNRENREWIPVACVTQTAKGKAIYTNGEEFVFIDTRKANIYDEMIGPVMKKAVDAIQIPALENKL